ncbi:uncharacterized protein FIBRA_09318 [Fibroporia radiculosa]|uniref:Uncharacterized protein n=1 Tax=Fibroporia radiculosa TaxID=599839 RepID=J7RVR6_9APHY|nr:uncharacterized protein FIBRA_09318 [Fibroporia radiculosa]CCM07000.1 predicted protein [Fibroporia radiculosa]
MLVVGCLAYQKQVKWAIIHSHEISPFVLETHTVVQGDGLHARYS